MENKENREKQEQKLEQEFEYDANLVTLDDLYNTPPESVGFSSDSYYDSDEYF